jgi:hypothetical protein
MSDWAGASNSKRDTINNLSYTEEYNTNRPPELCTCSLCFGEIMSVSEFSCLRPAISLQCCYTRGSQTVGRPSGGAVGPFGGRELLVLVKKKSKSVPLHAVEALEGEEV